MRQSSLIALFILAASVSAHATPADPAALKAMPDYAAVRSEFLSAVVTAPIAKALAWKPAYRDTPWGKVRVSVEKDGNNVYVLFLRERDGSYPYGSRGNVIVRRDAATGYMREILWMLSDDGLSWLSLTPKNERTLVQFVAGGSLVRSGLSLNSLLYYFLMKPFSYLHDLSKGGIEWPLVLGPAGNQGAAAFADQLAAAKPSKAAAAFLKAAAGTGPDGAYLEAAGHPQAAAESLTSLPWNQAWTASDARLAGPYATLAPDPDKGLPLAGAGGLLVSLAGAPYAYMAELSAGDTSIRLALVPVRGADGSYAIHAFDAESRARLGWADLVAAHPDAWIRIARYPVP